MNNNDKETGFSIAEAFRSFSRHAAAALGSPWMFVANVFLILVWLGAGPHYHYSDTWQLVVNTATTVITYLAVFLIQSTQNRDAVAIHLKLDELIVSIEGARNRLVNLENLSEEEVAHLEEQFKRLQERAGKSADMISKEMKEKISAQVETELKDDVKKEINAEVKNELDITADKG